MSTGLLGGQLPGLRALLAFLFAVALYGSPAGRAQTDAVGAAAPVSKADAVCAQCHLEIYRRYTGTTMANGSGMAMDHLIAGSAHHAGSHMDYRISASNGAAVLGYAREGRPELQGTERLLYFLGSGYLGTTYLYSLNGYLLESPVAYYSKSAMYDMAPGLEGVSQMPNAMPMSAGCMRCHMSGVRAPDPGTKNHFTGAPFHEGGITCERCHGDATRHVQTGGKAAVINPARLEAAARDSVCISCHLEGDASVERKGRSISNWKPGEDISEYVAYFGFADDGTRRSVSETEQLSASHCKRASGAAMSCMSCHDPHGDPAPAQRVAYYRGKCLACHTQPKFATAHYAATPDCTQCHMPKAKAQDTPHVAWTDHRILRTPESLQFSFGGGQTELVSLLGSKVSSRDLGLAYYGLVTKGRTGYADKANQLLTAAAGDGLNDPPLLLALGNLSRMEGRTDSARTFFEDALKADPVNLEAANDLAALLAGAGEIEKARGLLRGAFERNEDDETLGVNLSIADCFLGDGAQAAQVLRRVLVYNPGSDRARQRLQAVSSGAGACVAAAGANGGH